MGASRAAASRVTYSLKKAVLGPEVGNLIVCHYSSLFLHFLIFRAFSLAFSHFTLTIEPGINYIYPYFTDEKTKSWRV